MPIELERSGDVFVLRLREGENRLNRAFLDAVNASLDRVEKEGPAALVTTGDGKFYSNGLDLAWMAEQGPERAGPFLADVYRLFARMLAFPAVTVAALNGHAFAAGLMFALAHDFRVMREDRGFVCLPEVDIRIPLQPGMTALIRARLPARTAHEAIVTGRRYGAPDAFAAGIVDERVPEPELLPRALARAAEHAAKHAATLAALKRGLYADALSVLEGLAS